MAALFTWLTFAAGAAAQAPINSDVALQPPRGGVIVRQQFRFAQADLRTINADLDIRLTTSSTTAVYGVTDAFTLLLNMPAVISRRIRNNTTGSSSTDGGLADITALSKIRLYRSDGSPSDTMRFDALAGFELPTGADAFSSDSFDPIIGGVFTIASGRRFFDADLRWKFNTAGGRLGADLLRYDAAYLYRLWPATYTGANPAALNGLIEINGTYETNGDNELFLSPGVQYVTTRWIAEATIQLPVWQSLDNRPSANYIFGVSLRFQF